MSHSIRPSWKHPAMAAAAVLALEYLFGAFVAADLGWLSGMFTSWDRSDRVSFLYMTIALPGLAFFLMRTAQKLKGPA